MKIEIGDLTKNDRERLLLEIRDSLMTYEVDGGTLTLDSGVTICWDLKFKE